MNKIFLGIVLGICISLTLTCSYGAIQRFKSETKRTGLTLKQQVVKNTADIETLKKQIEDKSEIRHAI